ncbi:MAG TPA: glycosyltransferase family 1 protein [Acidimicrobiales bacterium]|nr:glycosyltransferase family 1 protein [Acidimicrobiales bacterium]
MRVGIDATAVLDEGTGVENHVLTVVDALARGSDHELVCFVRHRAPAAWAEWGDRVEIRTFDTDSQVLATQLLLPRAAKAAGIDVLYCGGKPPPAIYRAPLLVGIHDAIPWVHPEYMGSRRAVMWFRGLYNLAVRRGATIHTGCRASRDALAPVLGMATSAIQVVPYALVPWFAALIDGPDLPRPAQAPEGPYLLAVSRFDPRRGVTTLLDAWDILRADRPDLNLVLAGKVGWNVSEAVERARRTPGVVLTGEVDAGDLAGLYRHATALVSASAYEGFGLPVLEAMAFGTPVAASAIPPHLEQAADVAEFFPPADPVALAKAVGTILDDESVRAHAESAGRERASQYNARRLAECWTQAALVAISGTSS